MRSFAWFTVSLHFSTARGGQKVSDSLEKSRRFICQAERDGKTEIISTDRGVCSLSDTAWPFTPEHSSLVSDHLTPELYSELARRVTATRGYTIDDLILRGVEAKVVSVGIIAGDEECYDEFPEIFLPIMKSFHYPANNVTEGNCCDDASATMPLTIDGDRILSFRIRAARNLKGYDFIPYMTTKQRLELSDRIRAATDDVSLLINSADDKYFDPAELSPNEISLLVQQHLWRQPPVTPTLLFGYDGNEEMWPVGRAVWVSRDGEDQSSQSWSSLWVNEEDHLRVVRLESGVGRSLDDAFERWQSFMNATQVALAKHGHSFVYHDDFGYLNTCPTNIGTGIRISVRLHLPPLSTSQIHSVAHQFHLEVRSQRETRGNVQVMIHQVSNQQRWGLTQEEIYASVTRGVREILTLQDEVENKGRQAVADDLKN